MKTYYTKCGKVSFQKSSTAAVTRFEEINEHCESCPYIENGSTYRKGEQVPITYCQAGSKEPNKKTDYSTTREDDTTTLSILSLDMQLLKEIYEYAASLDGCINTSECWPNVFHGMDRDDCRKSMPLTFESNKKGKYAKKSIIQKFFSEAAPEKDPLDPDWPSKNCIDCESCKDDECTEGVFKNCCPSKITPGVKACPRFRQRKEDASKFSLKDRHWKPKCPYLSAHGNTFIDCCAPNARRLNTVNFDSQKACSDKANNHCFDRFMDCEDYRKYYADPSTWEDWAVPERRMNFRTCNYCCNNSGYTGLPQGYDGGKWCFCQKKQEPVERGDSPCAWFNRHPNWEIDNDCESPERLQTTIEDPLLDTDKDNCNNCGSGCDAATKAKNGNKACSNWIPDKPGLLERLLFQHSSNEGDDKLKCTKLHCPFNNNEISECCFEPAVDDAHEAEMKEARDQHGCTNEALLDILKKLETKKAAQENACPYGKLSCDCPAIGFHGECQVIRRKDWDRYYFVGEMQKYNINCETFKELSEAIIAEKKPEKKVDDSSNSVNDLVEIDTKPAVTATFDYTSVDNDTAAFLQEKEQKITQIRMMSVMAIGKELKEVHEKLANNKTGTFEAWVKSLGISHQTSRNYINAYEYILKNFEHIEDADQIQPSLLFAVSKPSAPKELQEKVISGDITSHKQYKEMEARLKAAEDLQKEIEAEAMTNVNNAISRADKAEARVKELDESLRKLTRAHAVSPAEAEKLKKELEEAKRQVEILTDELMKPVDIEPAVVERIPEETERELAELREQTGLRQDYSFIANILGKLLTAHPGMLKNWAKITGQENSKTRLQAIRGELIDIGTTIESMIDYLDEEIQMKYGGETWENITF